MYVDKFISVRNLGFLAIYAIIFYVIADSVSLRGMNDDSYYSQVLTNGTLWDFINYQYNHWSGRLLLDSLMVSTINIPIFWKYGIPFCLFLICYCIWEITLKSVINIHAGIILNLVLLFSIDTMVLIDGAWWVTGFYNYLLPISLSTFIIATFLKKEQVSQLRQFFVLLTIFLCSYQEQVMTLLFVFTLYVLFKKKMTKQPINFTLFVLLLLIINGSILFFAPGNYNRYLTELYRLPEYADFYIWDKAILAIDRINNHLLNNTNILLIIMSGLLFVGVHRSSKITNLKALLEFALLLIPTVCLLQHLNLAFMTRWIVFDSYLSPSNWSSFHIFIFYGIGLFFINSVLFSNYLLARDKRELAQLSIPFLFAIFYIAIICLSPTVYASANRVLLLSDVLFMIYIGFLIKNMVQQLKLIC